MAKKRSTAAIKAGGSEAGLALCKEAVGELVSHGDVPAGSAYVVLLRDPTAGVASALARSAGKAAPRRWMEHRNAARQISLGGHMEVRVRVSRPCTRALRFIWEAEFYGSGLAVGRGLDRHPAPTRRCCRGTALCSTPLWRDCPAATPSSSATSS